MKMNRTEWAVVFHCAIAMFFVFRYNTPPAKPLDTGKKEAVEAATVTAPAAPGEKPAVTPGTAETPAAPASTPEQIITIKNPAAETSFTTKGGGISEVKLTPAQYAGKLEYFINRDGRKGAIGAFSREPGNVDTLDYTVAAQTAKSITFKAKSGDLDITREWTQDETTEPADGSGYLWKLKITITNSGTEKHIGDYSLYAGIMTPVRTNHTTPMVSWYANGSATEETVSEKSGF